MERTGWTGVERQCSGLSGAAQADYIAFAAKSGIDTSDGDGIFQDFAAAQITPPDSADQSTPRSIMLQSLVAALQSSGAAAQHYGADALLAACVGADAEQQQELARLGVAGKISSAIMSGTLKAPALSVALEALEAMVTGHSVEHALTETCVASMLTLLHDCSQPAANKTRAASIIAALLHRGERHVAAFRELRGLELLAGLLPGGKGICDSKHAHVEQAQAVLLALSAALSADAMCKEDACSKAVLSSIICCMQDHELAKLSLDAIAVLVEGKPGDRCIMRSCAEALCACGAAGSLLKLVMGAPEQHTSVKALEVLRKLAAAGRQELAALQKAGCLETCIGLVATAADLESSTAHLAAMLLRDFADWDADSRATIVSLGGARVLLEALQSALLEELPIAHDIMEVLSMLTEGDSADNSSTGGKTLLHWAAQYGDSELVADALDSNPLPDPRDARGNTPLHLAVINAHTGVARQLLRHNADVLACNSQGSWSLDMAAADTPVWDALYEEISWRSSLEQPRLCQLVLDGWEGPASCTFSPLQGTVCIAESSCSPSRLGAKWLPKGLLGSRPGGKPHLPLQVRMPHTMQIRPVGLHAVELDFLAVDLLLGQTFPAVAEPGGRHLRHLLITDTDAQPLCAALRRMQQRAHPDTTEFALRFQRYNQLYEHQKVAQINAQARLTAFAAELQGMLQAPCMPQQLAELAERISSLAEDIETGRASVLDAHRAVLDCSDSAIARLGTLRVECEKAEAEGGDESWRLQGEHALASLGIVRAYRERALHHSYSGALPPSGLEPPHRGPPGASAEAMDSTEQGLLAWLTPCAMLRPAAVERTVVHTDLELLQALRSLRDRCAEEVAALSDAPQETVGPTLARTPPQNGADPSAGPPERAAAAAVSFSLEAEKRIGRGSDSTEHALSMTGLMHSGSVEGGHPLPAVAVPDGGSSSACSSACWEGDAGDDDGAASESPSSCQRHAAEFMAAAPYLAASVLRIGGKAREGVGSACMAGQKDPGLLQDSSSCSSLDDSAYGSEPRSSSSGEVEVPAQGRSLPLTPAHGSLCSASGAQQEPASDDSAMKDGRRAESFTFALVSPARDGSRSQGIVRATASEPCEVLDFSRLDVRQAGQLRHGVSLPPLQGVTPVEGSPHGLPQSPATPSHAHELLDSELSTGEWNNQSEHHKLAKALAEHMQKGTVHAEGVGGLHALLGSDEGTPGGNTATAEQALQAALDGIPQAPQITGAAAQPAQHMPGAAAPPQQTCNISGGIGTADQGPMGLGSSDQAVQKLTAEIVAGAQRAALEAISSSMQVAGDAVKELPAWAGPDVIIAATMSRLDGIVAAANAQFSDMVETAVARAAATVTSLSAEAMEQRLQARKRAARLPSPIASPRAQGWSPAAQQKGEGRHMDEGGPRANKPISKRFLDFAQHSRSSASIHGSAPSSSGVHASSGSTSAIKAAAHDDAAAVVQQDLSAESQQEVRSEQPSCVAGEGDILEGLAKQAEFASARCADRPEPQLAHMTGTAAFLEAGVCPSATGGESSRGNTEALLSSWPGAAGGDDGTALSLLDTLPSRTPSHTELGELAAAGVEFQAALLNSNASSVLAVLRPAAQTSGYCSDQSAPTDQDGDWAAAASASGCSGRALSSASLAQSGSTVATQASSTGGTDEANNKRTKRISSSTSSVRSWR